MQNKEQINKLNNENNELKRVIEQIQKNEMK